jgi:hypothetical protein
LKIEAKILPLLLSERDLYRDKRIHTNANKRVVFQGKQAEPLKTFSD